MGNGDGNDISGSRRKVLCCCAGETRMWVRQGEMKFEVEG
jgi:hypothetical protein